MNKTYLYVPYNYIGAVKKLGCRFDWGMKKWYVLDDNINHQVLKEIFIRTNFRYVICYDQFLDSKPCQELKYEPNKMLSEIY